MSTFESIDFFTDQSLVPDPHPYFDYLRSQNPVLRLPHHGVFAVTGYEEATEIYKDPDTFSNIVALGGPFPPLPFQPEGDDISPKIDQHRSYFPMNEHMVTMDPPDHTRARSVLSRLLTPSRLKQNEEFMWRLADRQLDEFLTSGECEFISEYSKPFATLVIADLLGVPEEDHKEFRVMLGAERPRVAGGRLKPRVGRRQSAGMARREVLRLHRGAATRAAQRRVDLARDGEVSGRIHTRGHRRGPFGHIPFRCGTGNHGQAAQRRAAGDGRSARHPATVA